MSPKPNLDILRAIAITLVVIDHLLLCKGIQRIGPWASSEVGLFGVYLFFIHTSLVLMWSLDRRPNPLDFYLRRLFRIYPLAVFSILLAVATHAPVSGFFNTAPLSLKTLFVNFLLMPDLLAHQPYILGVIWSLGPELYMYALLPVLFFYARSVRKIWPLVLVWVLVVLWDHRLFGEQRGNIFPMLIPNFLCGIIAYVGFMRRTATLPAWLLLPFLSVAFCFYMSVSSFRMDWLVCMAVGLLLPSFRQSSSKLWNRICHKVAEYSYGIYLLHPFALVLGIYFLAGKPFALQLLVTLAPLAIAVYAAFRWIESPMIVLGARVAARLAHERGIPSMQSLATLEPAP